MFKKRVITALSLLIVFLVVTFYLPILYFSLLMALVVAGAAWEWSLLAGLIRPVMRGSYVFITLLFIGLLFFLSGRELLYILGLALLAWLWAFYAVMVYAKGFMPLGLQNKVFKLLLGWLLLIACWASATQLRVLSVWSLLVPLILVWVNDTGAYLTGRFWGKRLWVARVSPKKTWEGFFGGMLCSLVVAVIILWVTKTDYLVWSYALLLTVLIVLFANLGDLLESVLKRQAGVKDSGHLLPGHGGVLDRIDGLLAALPFALWFWFLFMLEFKKI